MLNASWQHTAPVLIGLMQNDNKYRIASQRGWEEHRLCSPIALELKPDRVLYRPVTLGNALNFSEPQCSPLSNGSSSTNHSNWHQFPAHQVVVTDKWGNFYKPCSTWHIAGLEKGLSNLIILLSINLHHEFWVGITSLQSIFIANAYRCPFIKGGSLHWVEEWVSRGKSKSSKPKPRLTISCFYALNPLHLQ